MLEVGQRLDTAAVEGRIHRSAISWMEAALR
jgi:hypothetical protein